MVSTLHGKLRSISIASEVDCSSLMTISQAISAYNRCSDTCKHESTRIPASIVSIFKAPAQDDRAVRQNAQIHANLAIAYELAAYVMEAHSSASNACYYRQCANAEVTNIPIYLQGEYRQQLSHALYVNGYLR